MALTQLAPVASQRSSPVATTAVQLASIDNLPTLVITMLVMQYAAHVDGPTGDEWPLANPTRAAILEPFSPL